MQPFVAVHDELFRKKDPALNSDLTNSIINEVLVEGSVIQRNSLAPQKLYMYFPLLSAGSYKPLLAVDIKEKFIFL